MDRETLFKGIKQPWKVPPHLYRMFYAEITGVYSDFKWKFDTERNNDMTKSVGDFQMTLVFEDEDISRQLYYNGEYESEVVEYIQDNVQSGDNVVDVGAHIGYYTLHMASQVGCSGQVHAFEPHPKNFDILKENIMNNGFETCVEMYNIALYNNNKEMDLFVHPSNKGMHSLVEEHSNEVISVKATKGDNILDKKIDLIKIDVEGAEPAVIDGMWGSILNDKPLIIFENRHLEDTDFIHELSDIGYRFTALNKNECNEYLSASEVASEQIQSPNIIAEI